MKMKLRWVVLVAALVLLSGQKGDAAPPGGAPSGEAPPPPPPGGQDNDENHADHEAPDENAAGDEHFEEGEHGEHDDHTPPAEDGEHHDEHPEDGHQEPDENAPHEEGDEHTDEGGDEDHYNMFVEATGDQDVITNVETRYKTLANLGAEGKWEEFGNLFAERVRFVNYYLNGTTTRSGLVEFFSGVVTKVKEAAKAVAEKEAAEAKAAGKELEKTEQGNLIVRFNFKPHFVGKLPNNNAWVKGEYSFEKADAKTFENEGTTKYHVDGGRYYEIYSVSGDDYKTGTYELTTLVLDSDYGELDLDTETKKAEAEEAENAPHEDEANQDPVDDGAADDAKEDL